MANPWVIATMMMSALLVTGCGSDGETDALSTQEWIEEVNAICVEVKADQSAIPPPQTLEEFTSSSDQIIVLDQQAVAKLKELGLPDGDDAVKADVIVQAFDEFIAAREEVVDAVIAGGSISELSPEAQTRVEAFQTALENVNQLTQDFGLTDCLVES
jgi:hypothetical protein